MSAAGSGTGTGRRDCALGLPEYDLDALQRELEYWQCGLDHYESNLHPQECGLDHCESNLHPRSVVWTTATLKQLTAASSRHHRQAAGRLHRGAEGVERIGDEPGNALRGDGFPQQIGGGLQLCLTRYVDDLAP